MQTTNDRLIKYCEEHKLEMPFGHHLMIIGRGVINALKEKEQYVGVEKITVNYEMEVNSYSDELIPIIDETIGEYFKNRTGFVSHQKNYKASKPKKFSYDVEVYKSAAFERALKICELPFEINEGFGNKNGKVQYVLPIMGIGKCITLGKNFQKERDNEKRKRRWEQKNNQPEPNVEVPIEETATVKKRTRKKIEK